MPARTGRRRSTAAQLALTVIVVLAGTVSLAAHWAAVLSDSALATAAISPGLWQELVVGLGAPITASGDGAWARVPLPPILAATGMFSIAAWLAGAGWIAWRRKIPFSAAVCAWGSRGWLWWLVPVAWEILGTAADLAQSSYCRALWQASLPFWDGLQWAGWLTCFFVLAGLLEPRICAAEQPSRVPRAVWIAIAAYFLCFSAMNWQLYAGLWVPHGDSAMYEEHLWNLLHGKGFRSYLDQGRLFLGEHVQVIHLLAIPAYLVWPSHLLLELCQSACLALGAVPVFRIAQRHSRSTTAGALLAIAYLLYFPMQYLDIAADFKTFRPNSFEIPLLLMALDALERRRYRLLLIWLGMTLLCQEDAAVVIAPLGTWIALAAVVKNNAMWKSQDRAERRRLFALGCGLAVFGVAYTVAVVKVILPWFRGGAEVHFARYFADLGETSSEITLNVLTHPGLIIGKLVSAESVVFALALLAPLGFLPLLSPSRLAVAAPLAGVLCLSEITRSPLHHFHAPLVPILFWAAAAALPKVGRAFSAGKRWWSRRGGRLAAAGPDPLGIPPEKFIPSERTLPAAGTASAGSSLRQRRSRPAATAALWALLSSALCGAVFTFSPLGFEFWDPYSRGYWRKLYVPGERARRFPAVLALVPQESRVASTDYIHPRFTHHERSYDYSLYRRQVPEDTEFIVIDTQHPYSQIKRPDQIDELKNEPGKWEVLDDTTGGYFIVLKRR